MSYHLKVSLHWREDSNTIGNLQRLQQTTSILYHLIINEDKLVFVSVSLKKISGSYLINRERSLDLWLSCYFLLIFNVASPVVALVVMVSSLWEPLQDSHLLFDFNIFYINFIIFLYQLQVIKTEDQAIMSVVSPKAKPTACDACRKLGVKCSLNNYVDDCERCTSLKTSCFVTDDYNITIHKVPQRALQNFRSVKFLVQMANLRRELEDSESDGKNTYVIIDAVVSNFEGISKEAINYPEFMGFFALNFSSLINWIKIYSGHQVWNVAKYDQKTLQSL